jgi:outer membrane lipase/esterase
MGIGRWAGCVLALALAAPAAAETITDYTSFHVLGDSLSDAGNVYNATAHLFPESPPYWNGRFSNGPLWADRVIGAFQDADRPTGNHAWAGSNVAPDGIDVPDIAMQAARYRSLDDDRVGDRPLLAIWSGGNDVLDMAGESGVRTKARRAAARLGDIAGRLLRSGTDDFMFLNLPDIGAVPKFGDDRDAGRSATRATKAFNRELDRQIAALRDDGATVTKVNVYGLFEDLLEHPRRYGVSNTTTPCLDEDDNACTRRQGLRRAFFDEIHPNRVVHKRIAEAALGKLGASAGASAAQALAAPAAVPLPPAAGLLGAGLLALAGLRYQRSRRGPTRAPRPVTPRIASPYQTA